MRCGYGYMTEYNIEEERRIMFYDYFFKQRIHALVVNEAPIKGRLLEAFSIGNRYYRLYKKDVFIWDDPFNYAVIVREVKI